MRKLFVISLKNLDTESDNFTSSFPNWMPFVFSSCLIALARTSSTSHSLRGESGHSCLVPHLRGKIQFFTTEYDIGWGFVIYDLYYTFFASVDDHLIFILLMWYITLIDFHMLNNLCAPGWISLDYDVLFFMYFCIRFGSILFRMSYLYSSEILNCSFLFCVSLARFWYQLCWLYKMCKKVLPLSIFWKSLGG